MRTETAEALYIMLETEDFEFDTEDATDALSSAEWYLAHFIRVGLTHLLLGMTTKQPRRQPKASSKP